MSSETMPRVQCMIYEVRYQSTSISYSTLDQINTPETRLTSKKSKKSKHTSRQCLV